MISILTYSARWQQHKEAYALSTIRFTHKTMMTMKMNKKQQQAFLCFRLLFRASAPLLPLLLSIYQSPKSGNEIRSIFSLSISLSLAISFALSRSVQLFDVVFILLWHRMNGKNFAQRDCNILRIDSNFRFACESLYLLELLWSHNDWEER